MKLWTITTSHSIMIWSLKTSILLLSSSQKLKLWFFSCFTSCHSHLRLRDTAKDLQAFAMGPDCISFKDISTAIAIPENHSLLSYPPLQIVNRMVFLKLHFYIHIHDLQRESSKRNVNKFLQLINNHRFLWAPSAIDPPFFPLMTHLNIVYLKMHKNAFSTTAHSRRFWSITTP